VPAQHDGYVYFIRMLGHPWVKIGFTSKPKKRLSYIRLLLPDVFKFKLVAAFPGTYADEKELHAKLSHRFSQGEWYRISPAIRKLIKQHGVPVAMREYNDHRSQSSRAGRPRKVPHVPRYKSCPCMDCRLKRKAKREAAQ